MAAGAFADQVYDGRNRTLSAWESDAATSFRAELRTLGTATEGVQGAATSLGNVLSGLAVVLRRAQEDMASAREVARSGGLTVAGTVIFAPGPAPATPATLPVDATPAEAAAHDRAVAAGLEHSRRVEAWNAAVLIADAADRSWAEALSDAQATWADRGDEITSLLQDLFSGAAQEYLQIRGPCRVLHPGPRRGDGGRRRRRYGRGCRRRHRDVRRDRLDVGERRGQPR